MNKVVLIGRLTKDPELKFTPGNGTAVCSFNIAVDNPFKKDANGKRQADFIPIIVWGKRAESVANYMSKGRLIGISGRIQTRTYDAKDGTKRYVTEVIADETQFLDKGNSSSNSQNLNNSQDNNYGRNFGDGGFGDDITPIDDGDIPF